MSINEIELTIPGREISLGGFGVKRVLPYQQHRAVGPFVFLDHMGPHVFGKGFGMSISPHPHIGLSTLTYLLEGRVLHRDSLGNEMTIEPGAVNWMTAGSGVAHSERSVESDLEGEHRLNGLQLWVALPDDQEDCLPSFHHIAREELPQFKIGDCACTLVAGSIHGKSSKVPVYSPLFLLDVKANAGEHFAFDPDGQDLALYVAQGVLQIQGQDFEAGRMVVFKAGSSVQFRASSRCHVFVLGGQALPKPKHMWWNFVSSSKEKIEEAKRRWEADEFPAVFNESRFSRAPLPRA